MVTKDVRIPVRRAGKAAEAEPQPSPDAQVEEEKKVSQATDENTAASEGQEQQWRDTALRLKADMENYRKRQRRWAEEEVLRERSRLFTSFLEVVDNLEQTLRHLDPRDPHHQSVKLAYDSMRSLLKREGIERISPLGEEFDPAWQEAIAMVPATSPDTGDMEVVEVVLPGYRLGERLLRPARVIVARAA